MTLGPIMGGRVIDLLGNRYSLRVWEGQTFPRRRRYEVAIFRKTERGWFVGQLPTGAKKGTLVEVPKKDGSIASVILAGTTKGEFGERLGRIDYPATARYRKDGRLPEAAKPKAKGKPKAKAKPKARKARAA